jgi:hypothetical protein
LHSSLLSFFGVNAFYLSNERCFGNLYKAVATENLILPTKKEFKKKFDMSKTEHTTGKIPDYSMNYKIFKIWKYNNCWHVAKSKSIFWFYFPLSIITIFVLLIFYTINVKKTKKIDIKGDYNNEQVVDFEILKNTFVINK